MKIYYIFFLAILSSSCSKFLDESPKELASETFYKTAAEMESAVYASYEVLQKNQTTFGRHYHTIHMSQVDYGYGRGSYAPPTNFEGLDATNINRVADMWASFYLSIRNANLVIQNAQRSKDNGVPEATVNALVAEARYMRAFCYFYLVQNWAGVPLRTELNMSEKSLPRASVAEVYNLIVEDLKVAEEKLPDVQALIGRATKWAAKTLYTDVLVNLKQWEAARNKAYEVIQSGKFSLLPISQPNDYYKIFGPDVINTPEEIFYIKFTGTKPSNFVFMLHHPSSPYYGGEGAYGIYTDSVKIKEIVEWDYHDFRKSYNLYNHDIGVGSTTTMLYKKFIEPNRTLGLSTDYPVYRFADLLLLFAEASCEANNGPTQEAMESVNELHRRAYGYAVNSTSPADLQMVDFPTKEAFLNKLYQERMYELFCEGKRFLELKRTGKLAEAVLKNHNRTVAVKALLWPIPSTEFFYNDAIDEIKDQNPGY